MNATYMDGGAMGYTGLQQPWGSCGLVALTLSMACLRGVCSAPTKIYFPLHSFLTAHLSV